MPIRHIRIKKESECELMFFGITPMGGYNYTANISINNGSFGIGAFFGGLLRELATSFGIGSVFGYRAPVVYSGNTINGMGGNVYGALNNTHSIADERFSNLKQIFPKYNVLKNPDGTFILANKDGSGIEMTGSYKELIEKAEEDGKKAKTQGSEKEKTDTSTPSSEEPASTPTSNEPSSTPTSSDPSSTPTSSDPSSTPTSSDPSSTPTSSDPSSTPTSSDPSSTPTSSDPSSTPTSEEPSSSEKSQKSESKKQKTQGAKASKNRSPKGWYRANNVNEGKIAGLLTPGSTPMQVLNKILQGKMDYLSNDDRVLLAKELERKNPSIFSKGKVKAGADLGKLDIPTINYIKENYVEDVKITSTGRKQYSRKKANSTKSKEHGSANSNPNTIKGKNGYYASKGKDGWHYYDPSGTAISGAEFKKYCPTIYNTTIQGHAQVKSPGTVGQSNGYMGSHLRR